MRNFWSRLRSAASRLLPSSLTTRVFVLYGLNLVVFVGGGLGYFLRHEFHQNIDDTQASSVMLIEVVAQAVQESVVIGDYDAVKRTLEKGVQGSSLSSASFIDLSGGVIRAEAIPAKQRQPPAWLLDLVRSRLDDVNRTVSVGGRDYGVLRLEFDASYAASNLWSLALVVAAVGSLSLVGGLVLIRLALGQWLGGLERLRAVVQSLGSGDSNVAVLVEEDAPEEIRRVVQILNQTTTLLREREASRRALDDQKFAMDQHAIVSISDERGNIVYANDKLCAASGYRRDELLKMNLRALRSDYHSEEFFVEIKQTLAEKRVWHGEMCALHKSGVPIWLDTTIVNLPSDEVSGFRQIIIRTDVSDRKAGEAMLNEARVAAEQASVAKSRFVANMSHEIRTPMNAILGMLKLLQGTALTARQSDYAEKAEGAAKSLLGLLNDILDFSKVEAGKMTLDPKPFKVQRLLRDLSVVLSTEVQSKPVELRFDTDADMPEGVLGDDMRLQQVLINLGSNAIKFTAQGMVVVRVRVLERQEQQSVLLKFSVSDSGIGIAPENQARIFSGFTQAESSTTRRFGGTGLGLAISQRLVNMMGGELKLDSALGQGSTFYFQVWLPLADAPEDEQPLLLGSSGAKPRRLSGLKLLVVEDNPNNQQVAQELLEAEGAEVELADNGALGVAAVEEAEHAFDAVLMDLQMPEMDGFEATKLIRQMPQGASLPIIAMTANAMASDRQACLDAGMNDHVGKPFDLGVLVATLLRHTGRAEQPPSQGGGVPRAPVVGELPAELLTTAAHLGVDLAQALQRLGGDVGVYLRASQFFLKDLSTLPGLLRMQLEQGLFEEAERLLHSVKGLAGTLGFAQLSALAAEGERRFAAAEPAAGYDALLADVSAAFAQTQEVLGQLCPQLQAVLPSPRSSGPIKLADRAQLRGTLAELAQLLRCSDMRALEVFEQFLQRRPDGLEASLTSLDEAISVLDFPRALQECELLAQSLEA